MRGKVSFLFSIQELPRLNLLLVHALGAIVLVGAVDALAQQDGPSAIAEEYLAEMGLKPGPVPHTGENCWDITEVILAKSSARDPAFAECEGMPVSIAGAQGTTIHRKKQKAPVRMRFDLAATQGTCASNGAGDVPNCCNYEHIPEGRVWIGRTHRVVSVWGWYRFWPNVHVTIAGVEIPIPDALKNIVKKRYKIGEYLELGPWMVVGADSFLINLCNCDSKYERYADFEYPATGDEPRAPTPPSIADGDVHADVHLTYPVSSGNHPPLPVCTASNDWATGTGVWSEVWSVKQWDTRTVPICEGLDEIDCQPIFRDKTFHYAAVIEMVATLGGDLTCKPAPVTGGGSPHVSHADCAVGCGLEPVDSVVRVTYTRSIELTPVLRSFHCENAAGTVDLVHIGDYLPSFVTSQTGQTTGEPKNLCGCRTDGKSSKEQQAGGGQFVDKDGP